MEMRHGVRGTICNDIFFTENSVADATVLRHVSVEISRQNANLLEVKQRLAQKVRELGGTAIVNFRYGQKKHQWWELFLLKWDTESWHGEGDAVHL